jgi:hypothetical protein
MKKIYSIINPLDKSEILLVDVETKEQLFTEPFMVYATINKNQYATPQQAVDMADRIALLLNINV